VATSIIPVKESGQDRAQPTKQQKKPATHKRETGFVFWRTSGPAFHLMRHLSCFQPCRYFLFALPQQRYF
jgi:hypothetical protein